MFCPFNAAMARFTSETSVAKTESATEKGNGKFHQEQR